MKKFLNLPNRWYFLGLFIWVIPLLLFNNGKDSLIAHDETKLQCTGLTFGLGFLIKG